MPLFWTDLPLLPIVANKICCQRIRSADAQLHGPAKARPLISNTVDKSGGEKFSQEDLQIRFSLRSSAAPRPLR